MMEPNIQINYLAVVVAAVWAVVFGGLWYSPKLFGDRWAAHVGQTDKKPEPAQMRRAMAMFIVGMFLISFVLAYVIAARTPATWIEGGAQSNWRSGLIGGFFTWLGFVLPIQLGVTGFELKRWGYLGINASFQLINLLVMGVILASWH